MLARFLPLAFCVLVCTAPAEVNNTVMLDVPFAASEKDGCGAASAAMVMNYWLHNQTADPKAIYRELYSPAARGIYASALERYLKSHGFETYAFSGDWRDLVNHLNKGRPLIVALKTGKQDVHMVVAIGFDPHQNLIYKHDPAGRMNMKQHRAEFETQWKGANNWTLIALPAR